MGDRIELDFPARPDYLALVRTVVTMIASTGSKLPDARIDDLRLAVTEACANAIDAERRRPSGPEGPVVVRCWVEPEQIVVEVHDGAGGFDPDHLVPHPPPTRADRLQYERGLGIPLMRELADGVEFRAEGGGTTVRLLLTCDPRR
jgi:anti-sigma regulatory factor (Ser/Thr protein kinase)